MNFAELRAVWECNNPEPRSVEDWREYASKYTRLAERWLDEGYGDCLLKQPRFAVEVATALQHFQDERYFLSSYVVMPNHVHLTVKPMNGYPLEGILGSWKGYTAKRINEALGQSGSLWEQEGYDRIVRDSEHLYRVLGYIGKNPARAHIPKEQWVRWIHPEWERAGWGFDAD